MASAVYSFWVFLYNGWIDDSLLVEVKTLAQAALESRDLDAESRNVGNSLPTAHERLRKRLVPTGH